MKKKYKKRTKGYTKEEKKSLKELHYYEIKRPTYTKQEFKLHKDLVSYFINECKEEQEKQKVFNSNHISCENFLRRK